jgi:uncharacterized membrane protein
MSFSQKVFYQSLYQKVFGKFYNRSPHQQTFQLVRQSLRETNELAKARLIEHLKAKKEYSKQSKGTLSKLNIWLRALQYNLFLEPTIISWISLIFGLTFITLSILLAWLGTTFKTNSNFLITLFAYVFIFFIFFWLISMIFLLFITPKLEISWEQRWKQAKHQYLKKIQGDEKLARGNVKRAITYYRHKNQLLRFFWNLLWGGILIGCLPDKEFQNAVITALGKAWKYGIISERTTEALLKIYEANPFGLIAICALPFVGIFYLWQYRIPVNWLENVLSIIEFEEEMEIDCSDIWSEQDQIDATNYSLQCISSLYLDDDEENNS